MNYFYLLLGLVVLIASGEFLVKGAVRLALKFNVSRLVIGMTVVSLGTSAPELLVSVQAALKGFPDIATGNVIGSNIANISLILGITTLIFPIAVNKDSIRIDWPATMFASILMFLFMLDYVVEFWEGAILLSLLLVFVYWLIRKSRLENKGIFEEEETLAKNYTFFRILSDIGLIVLGCVGLVFGAKWLLEGAVGIASEFGISDRIIGVTIIAFGTSVPELITSVIAAFRKESDISIGNLIGSNLFNILGIFGITAMVKSIKISEMVLSTDIFWMLGITLLLFPLMYFGAKITRLKGAILLIAYFSYLYLLF